ncbi:MAG: hypothetical protein HY040_21275 [Planctomycetes bacterium]|nr:hypothetical protein [Planctomycetota bacterium]
MEKKQPDSWQRFQAMSVLGAGLLARKKYAEAEPLLLQGYAGLQERAAKMPAPAKKHLGEALERLVRLYDAAGQPENAAEWRRKFEAEKREEKKPGP